MAHIHRARLSELPVLVACLWMPYLKWSMLLDSHLRTDNLTPGPDLVGSLNVCCVTKYFSVKAQPPPTPPKILICYSRNTILNVFVISYVLLMVISDCWMSAWIWRKLGLKNAFIFFTLGLGSCVPCVLKIEGNFLMF